MQRYAYAIRLSVALATFLFGLAATNAVNLFRPSADMLYYHLSVLKLKTNSPSLRLGRLYTG